MKRPVIAALSLAASSGTVLAQDLRSAKLHSENAPPVIASARTPPRNGET